MNLSFRIKKKPDDVFGYLTDMQKYVSVHPVITKIDKTGNGEYLVHEKLKLGFIPFSFTYPVSIEQNSIDNTVTMRATVMKLTKIEMHFILKSEEDFTAIDENINSNRLCRFKQ